MQIGRTTHPHTKLHQGNSRNVAPPSTVQVPAGYRALDQLALVREFPPQIHGRIRLVDQLQLPSTVHRQQQSQLKQPINQQHKASTFPRRHSMVETLVLHRQVPHHLSPHSGPRVGMSRPDQKHPDMQAVQGTHLTTMSRH